MREVYVNIGSVEKAKGLNGILRKLEGDFDLVQEELPLMRNLFWESLVWICLRL